MDPLTLGLLFGGTAVNALGSLMNKPQRQTLDINGILARMGERENRYVNSVLGNQASIAGQNLAAQGIRGPAAAQVIGQIEAPLRSESLGRMQDAEARLREQQSALDAGYKQQKGNWYDTLFGDLGKTLGAGAGYLSQKKMLDELGKLDEYHLDKLRQIFESDLRPATQISASGQTPSVGGNNAQSGLDFTGFRRNLFGMIPPLNY